MINQKKCPACGKWTDGSKKRCVFCNSIIDPALRAQEERKKREAEREHYRSQNENRIERYLRKLEHSDQKHHKVLFVIVRAVFTVYMAILSFFIWLIAIISG